MIYIYITYHSLLKLFILNMSTKVLARGRREVKDLKLTTMFDIVC